MNELKRKIPKKIFYWVFLGNVGGCTTTYQYSEVQLPAYASSLFVDCSNTNGALNFQIDRQLKKIDEIDLEWAAKNTGDWGLASYSPLGQTLFQVHFTKSTQSFEASGRHKQWLDRLEIQSDGFLYYEGHKIGLRPDEFPCFFASRLPRSWLLHVTDFYENSKGLVLKVEDRDRRSEILIARHGSDDSRIWEVVTRWKILWGFAEKSVYLERKKDSGVTMSSEIIEGFACHWVLKQEE
jgi:hypothetical protein